jgi:PAS domain S-box-containing protein
MGGKSHHLNANPLVVARPSDMTAETSKQRELNLTEQRMNTDELFLSIRVTPIASILTDPSAPDNPIIAANQQFQRLTGYSEEELIGRNCRILVGPETESDRSAELRRAIEDATPRVVELTNYRKDGSKFMNAVMIAPILDDHGKLAFFIGSQMEVSRAHDRLAGVMAAERIETLTRQQRNVLKLMARGLRNRQIGEELGLTEKTIKMHRSALVRRLGVSTAGEAMRLAIEAGF